MRDRPNNIGADDIARQINKAVQAWTEANAELWVSSSRALNELSSRVTDAAFGTGKRASDRSEPRHNDVKPDPATAFGQSLYDIGSALFRAADMGSELLRSSLTTFYERYR